MSTRLNATPAVKDFKGFKGEDVGLSSHIGFILHRLPCAENNRFQWIQSPQQYTAKSLEWIVLQMALTSGLCITI